MPASGATGKIILVHRLGFEAELLSQIRNTIGRDRRVILHEEAVRGEEFKLNRQAQPRHLRFAVHKINVGKAQAPATDQLPIRNIKIHNATPFNGAERHSLPSPPSTTTAMFPQRSSTWPKSQLRADWA